MNFDSKLSTPQLGLGARVVRRRRPACGRSLRYLSCLSYILAWGILLAWSPEGLAQQHRATRLGHPSTRFAPPLNHPEQLRTLLLDPKLEADVASILKQAGWKGNVEDLRRAAATAEISDLRLPPGSRLPFMSSRKEGKPVALIDVLWAGDAPIEAYAFTFSSNGRRYHLITPRPCSNFYVKDLGPEAPQFTLVKSAPAEATACAPFTLSYTLRNTGSVPVAGLKILDPLPGGLTGAGGQNSVEIEAGDFRPGEARTFQAAVKAASRGVYASKARARSSEGAIAETATASTVVRAPALALSCALSSPLIARLSFDLCLSVTNSGDGTDQNITVSLPLPPLVEVRSISEGGVESEGKIVWRLDTLPAGSGRALCAKLVPTAPSPLAFNASVQSDCSAPVTAACSGTAAGVPAILLEVIDLEDPIEVGQEVIYEIRVLNQGTAPGTNVRLACTLPEEQEFVTGTGPSSLRGDGRNVVIEPIALLAPKETASWRLAVKATRAGDSRFQVELASDQFVEPIREVESTRQY